MNTVLNLKIENVTDLNLVDLPPVVEHKIEVCSLVPQLIGRSERFNSKEIG